MRILLDHCVPVDLAPHIRGHDVICARAMGWQDRDDGQLLTDMSELFDVLVTVDTSLQFQQSMANRSFALIVLRARSNRPGDLARLVPSLHRVLKNILPGDVHEISE